MSAPVHQKHRVQVKTTPGATGIDCKPVPRIAHTLLWLLLAILPGLVMAQNLDTGFDPDANGNVYALAKQPDGKLIVAGAFTSIAGTTRNRIARLNPDGSLDTGFASVYVDSTIRAAVVQADGRIVIGGDFDMASSRSVEHSPQSQYRVHTAHFSWNVTDLPTSTQVVAQTLVPTQIAGSKTWQYSQTTSSSSAVSSMR